MRHQSLKLALCSLFLSFLLSCDNDEPDLIANQNLVATWQVTAIHNSSPSGPTLGPINGEIISINFIQNGSFSGTTSINSFGGSYSISGDELYIEEMITTEALDTNFGQAFYESMDESRNSDTQFSEFIMKFGNNNELSLKYQNFRFLTLQKQ